MESHLRAVLANDSMARSLAESGLETIRARHTCAHRVDQLEALAESSGSLAHAEGAS
jgi:spore maturation protein CgeB